jgi:protein-S-isoprenylcysteine O-methyltransferase Ste14
MIYGRIVAACWLVFFLAWAILAVVMRDRRGTQQRTIAGLVVRLLLAAALVFTVSTWDGDAQVFWQVPLPMAATGAVVCVMGLAFAIWARVTLGANWGMPRTVHENPELVTWGPYRYVRHPIYTAMATMFIGTALVAPFAAIPGAFVIAYSVLSARREEQDMAQRFPDAYAEYRQRSKFFVPFLL